MQWEYVTVGHDDILNTIKSASMVDCAQSQAQKND